jgi:predicted AAA+ superfamily ATPase
VRKRHIDNIFKKILSFSSISGIFGHRQVGKSTYLQANVQNYFTLDSEKDKALIEVSPEKFINSKRKRPLVIDECQMEPRLFPALKNYILKNKRPGQFVLSGSVRFSSQLATRESLAGRLTQIEMLPLSIAEIESLPLPDVALKLLSQKFFDLNTIEFLNNRIASARMEKAFTNYQERGGLPGILFIREPKLREVALLSLINLMLDRDLRLVVNTNLSLAVIQKFISVIAQNSLKPYSFAHVQRITRLTPRTQKHLLYGLESIFLIRRISYINSSAFTYLLEDQLEEKFFSENKLMSETSILSTMFRNLRVQFNYRINENCNFESYLTRSGANVPLVLTNANAKLGFRVLPKGKLELADRRSADSFLRKCPDSKIVFLSMECKKVKVLDSHSLICHPVHLI